MANYYGAARSNYVRIKDMPGLVEALKPWPIIISPKNDNPLNVCFLSDDPDGAGWPSRCWDDGDNDETEWDTTKFIAPFMEPDQVLIIEEAGHEKLRYVTGWAEATRSDGRQVFVNINDIYDKAAAVFEIPRANITEATY